MSSNMLPEKKKKNNIMEAIKCLVSDIGLDEVKTTFDSKTKTASVVGNKNGIQYTTTLTEHKSGSIQTNSMFEKNLGKDVLKKQIKKLKQQGYKQQKIADMLGVSQSTVSNYLKS